MSPTTATRELFAVDELRRYKLIFDYTWMLTIVLATALCVGCWYFRLAQLDIGPIIWTLATLALLQLAMSSQVHRSASVTGVRLSALTSQLSGTVLIGIAWHLSGGLQQPLLPLFIVLPLVPGAVVFGFWERQVAMLALVMLLLSGVLLSADTNSFMEERYGLALISPAALPAWLPRSRAVFADVSTSPAYDLMLTVTVGFLVAAVGAAARALASLCQRDTGRLAARETELLRAQQQFAQLVARAPSPLVLVSAASGRIVCASERFRQAFALEDEPGRFLLDCIGFAHPEVVLGLMASGGDDIQGATVQGRQLVLRVRAEIIGSDDTRLTALHLEGCEEVGWHGAADAVEDPLFAIDSAGDVTYLNRSARAVFGVDAERVPAAALFPGGVARWWDIAPLESARRILDHDGRRYLACIRRGRIAPSIGEMSFVHLQERERTRAVALS